MRCVVVGSGIAGLSAAIMAARLGHRVDLIEAKSRSAPLLRGFQRKGLLFDTGFHCGGGLHQGGILRRWLRVLGVESALEDIRTDHVDVFHFDDGCSFSLPAGHEAASEAVTERFPESREAFRDFLYDMEQILGHSPYLNPAIREEPSLRLGDGKTVDARLREADFSPHLRAILGARCLLYGVQPHEAAWEDYALVAGPYFQSSGSWQGGGAALADALEAVLRACGGVLHCGTPVAGFEADRQHGMRGVFLDDGTHLPCDICFFTGHPSQLSWLTPPDLLRPVYLRRLCDLPETPPSMLLFAESVAGPTQQNLALSEGHNIYLLPAPHNGEPYPPLESGKPAVCLFCGRCAEDGRQSVHVVALLRGDDLPTGDPQPRDSTYLLWKRRTVRAIQERVEMYLPGVLEPGHILDAASPLTLRHWIHGTSGSLYGVRHTVSSVPLLPVTKIPGLFLAGQNVLLPGVLGGIISAALAAGFAFGHDHVLGEFRQCVVDES